MTAVVIPAALLSISSKREFAVKLRQLRIDARWSQEYCACTCRVDVSTWKRWEHPEKQIMPSDLSRPPLAKLFPKLSALLFATNCNQEQKEAYR